MASIDTGRRKDSALLAYIDGIILINLLFHYMHKGSSQVTKQTKQTETSYPDYVVKGQLLASIEEACH